MTEHTYKNPILYADYSDPDVIRVGEDFYMVASSFTYLPGVPLLHSRDLVHWEQINYCVPSLPFEKYMLPSHGSGTWAPSIRFHKGEFFVFVPLPDEGILVARSRDPRGKFSLNLLCAARGWIDPCPFWDEDGRAYMVFAYARSRCGIKHRLALAEMDGQCRRLLGEPKVIFDGEQLGPTTEGPKLYKRQGLYYILMPSGGVAGGWQSALRAENIWGPYEYRIVMHQGNTGVNGPHQGGWTDTPDGRDWFVHFQDVGALGRITHLQPMCWNGGWPFIGCELNGDGIGEPVGEWSLPVAGAPRYRIADSDEFDGQRLGLQWQWQANPREAFYSLSRRPGWLCLSCRSFVEGEGRENLLWHAPNVLTQIPQSPAFTARVRVSLSQEGAAGDMAVLGLTGHRYAFLALARLKEGRELRLYSGQVTEKEFLGQAQERLALRLPWEGEEAVLALTLREDGSFFFSYGQEEKLVRLEPDFQAAKGTWTGAKLCLWAGNRETEESEGWGMYDYIRIRHGRGGEGGL